jgi:hypothetical protein
VDDDATVVVAATVEEVDAVVDADADVVRPRVEVDTELVDAFVVEVEYVDVDWK